MPRFNCPTCKTEVFFSFISRGNLDAATGQLHVCKQQPPTASPAVQAPLAEAEEQPKAKKAKA